MKISVSNFMAFQDSYEFDLRKINLFVGANNTGKSTLAKFFQWMKLNSNGFSMPSFMNKNNILSTDVNQARIVRRFRDLLHANSTETKIQASFSRNYYGGDFSIGLSYANYEGSTNTFNEDKIGKVYGELSNLVISFGNQKIYEFSKETDVESWYFSNFAEILRHYRSSIDVIDYFQSDYERSAPGFMMPLLQSDFERQLDSRLEDKTDQLIKDMDLAGTRIYSDVNTPIVAHIDLPSSYHLKTLFLFSEETRILIIKIIKELIGVMVSDLSNVVIMKKSTSLDDDFYVVDSTNKSLNEYFNLKFDINANLDNNGNFFGNTTYIKNGGNSTQLDDMGDGVKHILPLLNKIESDGWKDLLDGNMNRENKKTFFISEPENALHPNWQKKFIEFLINNRYDNYVVETHSLIIVRSLQLAVAEGQISPEDVAIYDFYEEKDGTKSMQPIRILPDGQLDGKFMNGFDDLVNDMELELWRISQNRLSIN